MFAPCKDKILYFSCEIFARAISRAKISCGNLVRKSRAIFYVQFGVRFVRLLVRFLVRFSVQINQKQLWSEHV